MGDVRTIKQHDRRPYLRSQILDGVNAPIPLGSDPVFFLMRPVSTPTLTLRTAAFIIDSANGVVEHRWAATGAPWGSGQHTGAVGVYDQEWERLVGGSEPMTSPLLDYNTIIVIDDIDYP